MASEWVKTEYETFYNEFYIKDKEERKFIILRGEGFAIDDVPFIFRRLQFANKAKEILNTLIKDESFRRKREEEQRQKEEKEEVIREQELIKELEGLALAQLKREQEEREEQFAAEKTRKRKEYLYKLLFGEIHIGWTIGAIGVTILLPLLIMLLVSIL